MLLRQGLAFAVLLLCAVSDDALAQGTGGLFLFEQRCASCHVNPTAGSRAPTREQLQGRRLRASSAR